MSPSDLQGISFFIRICFYRVTTFVNHRNYHKSGNSDDFRNEAAFSRREQHPSRRECRAKRESPQAIARRGDSNRDRTVRGNVSLGHIAYLALFMTCRSNKLTCNARRGETSPLLSTRITLRSLVQLKKVQFIG